MEYQKESSKLNNLTLVLIFIMLCCAFGHATKPYLYSTLRNILIVISIFRLIVCIKNEDFTKYKETFKYLLWFCIFIFFMYLSTKWSLNALLSMNLVKGIINTLLLIFPIVVYTTNVNKVKNIFKVLILSYLYICFRLIFFETAAPGTLGFGSVIGYHFNRIAVTLSYGILLCYYLFKVEKKTLYLLPMPVFYYIIFLTGSRKGLMMPVAFLCLFMVLSMGKNIKRMIKNIVLIIIIIILLMFIINSNATLKTRIYDLYNSFVNNVVTNDGSINERKYFRDTAIEIFKQKKVLGIGADGFRAYLLLIGYKKTISYSHCNYTELLATLGIIGFIIYYSIYIETMKNGIIKYSSLKYYKLLAITYITVQVIFEYGFVSYYMFEFQIILAIIFLNTKYELQEDKL